MKIHHPPRSGRLTTTGGSAALLLLFFLAATAPARGDIYVTKYGTNAVGQYLNDGTLVDNSLIPALNGPIGIAVTSSNIYVANSAVVGKYTLDGSEVAAGLVTESAPFAVAVAGSNLYVSDQVTRTVGKYTLDGTPVSAPMITISGTFASAVAAAGTDLFIGLFDTGAIQKYTTAGVLVDADLITVGPIPGLAVAGGFLYVSDVLGTVGKYNLDGTPVDAAMITGLNSPRALAVLGSSLYVLSFDGLASGRIGEYNAATGAEINPNLITGLGNVFAIAVTDAVPEPATWGLLAGGAVLLLAGLRRGTRKTA